MWDKTLGGRRSIASPWNVVLMSHESNLKEAEVNVKSQQSLMVMNVMKVDALSCVHCDWWTLRLTGFTVFAVLLTCKVETNKSPF